MNFKDGLKMASRDLGRRKGRTFLTALAVAVGTMLIVTLVSLGTSGEKLIVDKAQNSSSLKMIQVASMKYFDSDNTDYSDLDMTEMFKKIDNVAVKKFGSISGIQDLQATLSANVNNIKIDNKENKTGSSIIGLYNNTSNFASETIKSVRKNNNNNSLKPIIAGRNLNSLDKNSVLIGKSYLLGMGIIDYKSAIGKDIILTESNTENPNITIPSLQITGKIIGVIDDKFVATNPVVTSIDLANKFQSYYSLEDDYINTQGYNGIIIYANNINDVDHISSVVKNAGYYYSTYEEQIQSIENAFNIMNAILAVLGLIVLFVAAVGIVNTMIMVIYERTKSIGIMKSVGANRSNIHSIFIFQSAIIGFMGGIMGLIFSLMNIKIIQFALKMYLESKKIKEVVNFTMPSWLIIGTLCFSILISVLAGLYPAIKASKMDPVKALNS
ncbi:ABC transporter permease [Clostridium akagii]|uniref:ABC transporter permease n=1 Tax=Clostridium akagii TaxID=91623 RepID=UPI00047C9A16|nr:FtsX-like permease family protein [Clostridium akagii]